MAYTTVMISKKIGLKDIFPVEIKCRCGHLIFKIEDCEGRIKQYTKCTSCKCIVSIEVVKLAS